MKATYKILKNDTVGVPRVGEIYWPLTGLLATNGANTTVKSAR